MRLTRDNIVIYEGKIDSLKRFKDEDVYQRQVLKRKDGAVDMEPKMREDGVPEWFIDSCKKIKYMFPKAHAVAYVTMGFRIAYCKVNYPKAFYATYFTAVSYTHLYWRGRAGTQGGICGQGTEYSHPHRRQRRFAG